MNRGEHIDLIHALIAATNAFHNTLKEHGYTVSYGLDDSKTGSIKKDGDKWSLGDLTIKWNIE